MSRVSKTIDGIAMRRKAVAEEIFVKKEKLPGQGRILYDLSVFPPEFDAMLAAQQLACDRILSENTRQIHIHLPNRVRHLPSPELSRTVKSRTLYRRKTYPRWGEL